MIMTYIKVKIALTLTSKTPFHIGSGQFIKKPSTPTDEMINDVCKDVNQQPYIPAASLKGALRHMMEKSLATKLFGDINTTENNNSSKGALNVYPGFATASAVETHIETHNSIDEITGAAKNGHLFSKLYVGATQSFVAQLTGEHISHDQLEHFIAILNQGQLQLGSSSNNGNGLFEISKLQCQVLSAAVLNEWLDSTKPLDSYYTEHPLNAEKQPQALSSGLQLTLLLHSGDPLLIACPQERKRHAEQPDAKDLYFKRDNQGEPILPASSLRGMLRAQSRRIIRTLCESGNESGHVIAQSQVDRLSTKLWGDQDKPSSIQITQAKLCGNFLCHSQTFIAIDRVTGGVSKGAMQQVEAVTTSDHFQCDLFLNHMLLNPKNNTNELAPLALLLFTLRDLMAGQLSIGAAKSKGYGRIQAKIKIGDHLYAEFSAFCKALCEQLRLLPEQLEQHLQQQITELKGAA